MKSKTKNKPKLTYKFGFRLYVADARATAVSKCSWSTNAVVYTRIEDAKAAHVSQADALILDLHNMDRIWFYDGIWRDKPRS